MAAVVVFAGLTFTASAYASVYAAPASIASDCSVDVTQPLLSWIASVPDHSTLSFGVGQCYRIEGSLEIAGRNSLDLEGNGSTFRSFNPPADQRPLWRIDDSTGFVFHNMTLIGSYANGGTFDSSLQHAHAIDLRGTNAQVSGVTMQSVAGDCVYFGLGFTSALTHSSGGVHDSSCTGTGRNAISVTAGDNILVQHLSTNAIGYDVFDVEPNVGAGFGSRSVTFDANTIGSYYLSAYSIVENEAISNQSFTNNRVVGRGLKITVGNVGNAIVRATGVTISGNSSDTEASYAADLSSVDGLTVTGNTIPMTGGVMAAVTKSCNVNVSGNAYPGGTAESSIAAFHCKGSPKTAARVEVANHSKRSGKDAMRVAIMHSFNVSNRPGEKTTITVKGGTSVIRTQLYIDNVLKVTARPNSLTWIWKVKRAANGEHTITAHAYTASNHMASSSITVCVERRHGLQVRVLRARRLASRGTRVSRFLCGERRDKPVRRKE